MFMYLQVLNTTVEDTPVTEKAAASAQDSFVTEVVPTETEDSISDANDSNHLYGLLTKQKLDQVTLLPYQGNKKLINIYSLCYELCNNYDSYITQQCLQF